MPGVYRNAIIENGIDGLLSIPASVDVEIAADDEVASVDGAYFGIQFLGRVARMVIQDEQFRLRLRRQFRQLRGRRVVFRGELLEYLPPGRRHRHKAARTVEFCACGATRVDEGEWETGKDPAA